MPDGSESPVSSTQLITDRVERGYDAIHQEKSVLDLADEPPPQDKSGLLGATFNIIKCIMAAGILGTPFGMSMCGIGLGTLLLLAVAIVSDYSLQMLMRAAVASGETTYQGVARKAFGLTGYIAVTSMQFLYPALNMVFLNVIMGNTVISIITRFGGEFLSTSVLVNRTCTIFPMSLFIALPLSLYRNIAKYSKFSFLSLLVIGYVVIFVVVELVLYAQQNVVPSDPSEWYFAHSDFAAGVPIYATAMICHHTAFQIYNSMREKTDKAWATVVHASVAFVAVVLLVFSISGYATFRNLTEGDIFESYCSYDDWATIARMIFGINVMLSYPMQLFVIRGMIEDTCFSHDQPSPLWRHVLLTLVICLAAAAVSISTTCINIIQEITGVLSAIPLIFIMPALLYLKHSGKAPIWSIHNIPAIATASLGFIFCGFGLYRVVTHIVRGVTCRVDLPYCYATFSANATADWE